MNDLQALKGRHTSCFNPIRIFHHMARCIFLTISDIPHGMSFCNVFSHGFVEFCDAITLPALHSITLKLAHGFVRDIGVAFALPSEIGIESVGGNDLV